MAAIRGRALRWSTAGITYTAGVVSTSNASLAQRWNCKRSATLTKIKDENGSQCSRIYSDPEKTFTVDAIPVALSGTNTAAGAQSSVDAHAIAPGTKVTVVDANGTIADGDYLCDDSEIVAEVEGAVMIRLTLSKSEDNDITTTPS